MIGVTDDLFQAIHCENVGLMSFWRLKELIITINTRRRVLINLSTYAVLHFVISTERQCSSTKDLSKLLHSDKCVVNSPHLGIGIKTL